MVLLYTRRISNILSTPFVSRGVTFFLFVISDCSLFNTKNMQYNLHSALCFLSFHFWNLLTISFDCYFVFPALSTLPANVNMLSELYTFWTVELRWVDAKRKVCWNSSKLVNIIKKDNTKYSQMIRFCKKKCDGSQYLLLLSVIRMCSSGRRGLHGL